MAMLAADAQCLDRACAARWACGETYNFPLGVPIESLRLSTVKAA